MNKYNIIIDARVMFSSTFSVVGSVNFRTRLERPLVHSMGDSEIFHVQLLKMLRNNDPGNYDNFVLDQSLSGEGWENDQAKPRCASTKKFITTYFQDDAEISLRSLCENFRSIAQNDVRKLIF